MAVLQLELKPDEMARLLKLAHAAGYDTPDAYVQALVEDVIEEEADEIDIKAELRAALEDVSAGRVYPARDFRKMLDALDE
jgi:predicted transcriptional regulator